MNEWRTLQRLFQIAGIICLAVVTVLSLIPGDERPHVLGSGNIEHFIAYVGTAFFAASLPWLHGWRIVALLSVASLTFEGLQMFIPGRSPGLDNWLASSVGATVGLALSWIFVTFVVTRLSGNRS